MAGPDKVSVLIDVLARNPKHFELSTNIFKNGKPVIAIHELGMLRQELINLAKDPTKGIHQLGNAPKEPDTSKMSKDDADIAQEEYLIQKSQYEMAKMALQEHVDPGDMMAIEKYLEPFYDALAATSSIKGKKFHAFTKPIEESPEGLGAMFHQKRQ